MRFVTAPFTASSQRFEAFMETVYQIGYSLEFAPSLGEDPGFLSWRRGLWSTCKEYPVLIDHSLDEFISDTEDVAVSYDIDSSPIYYLWKHVPWRRSAIAFFLEFVDGHLEFTCMESLANLDKILPKIGLDSASRHEPMPEGIPKTHWWWSWEAMFELDWQNRH